jgi:hypothetical protein
VQELAEIIYQFGGTKRAHLLDDLDKLERLIQESANSAKPLVIVAASGERLFHKTVLNEFYRAHPVKTTG